MVGKNFNKQRKNVITDNIPCFFKFVQPGFTTHKLEIPGDFQKHLRAMKWSYSPNDDSCSFTRVILKDSTGGAWRVKLVEDGDYLVLLDGWKEFVRDHTLSPYEILLFGYEGNMSFRVQIFSVNGMERTLFLGHHQANSLEYPYFEKRLIDCNVNTPFQLYIPNGFARKHLPGKTTEITLQNSNGKPWNVMLLVNGRMCRLCKGWRNFVRENNLKVDNLCKFEVVDEKKMVVHIVP